MSQHPIILSDLPTDFQKVQIETVSLVNAASNAASGLGDTQAGIQLLLPAENLIEHNKAFSRLYLAAPGELIRNTLSDEILIERLREMLSTTPIRYHGKKHEQTMLDVSSIHFEAMANRIISMVRVVATNFRRDVGELVAIYDGFTQPALKLPMCNAFQAQAAFSNRELLKAYRTMQGMEAPATPTITEPIRKILERFGVATHGFALRDVSGEEAPNKGLMHAALPVGPAALKQAAQGNAYGKEVQLILHTLGLAVASHEIQPLVMNDAFRAALAKAVDAARTATYTMAAQDGLINNPHA